MPELQMPKLSDTMTEGTLVAWKKKKGEKVAAGEVLAEIETDKATMELEAYEAGVVEKVLVQCHAWPLQLVQTSVRVRASSTSSTGMPSSTR